MRYKHYLPFPEARGFFLFSCNGLLSICCDAALAARYDLSSIRSTDTEFVQTGRAYLHRCAAGLSEVYRTS